MHRGTVVVTGTSTGIGRATTLALARQGFDILAGVRNEADGEAVRALSPEHVTPLQLDVTDRDAIAALPERVGPRLAGLVNNAGLSHPGPLEFLEMDDVRYDLEVMLMAPLAITQALLPALRAGRGRVVMMGSIGGRSALPFLSPYNAAKFALEGVSSGLRMELAPVGVQVALIEPGAVSTPIWTKGAAAGDALQERLPEEGRKLYGARIDRLRKAAAKSDKRGIAPEEVAEAVVHALTSPKPRTRYLVGTDAKVQAKLRAVLPDRAFERLVSRVAGI